MRGRGEGQPKVLSPVAHESHDRKVLDVLRDDTVRVELIIIYISECEAMDRYSLSYWPSSFDSKCCEERRMDVSSGRMWWSLWHVFTAAAVAVI